MPKSARIDLGTLDGTTYFLYVETRPGWNKSEKFVATVYYRKLDPETLEEEKLEVVRIDNMSHGFCHIDKLYKEDRPREKVDMTVYEAWDYLEENWKTFARKYNENH